MATIFSTPTTVTVTSSGTSTVDAAADWLARSTAAGVMWAENFSRYGTAADLYNYFNRGAMVGHLCPKNPSMGSTWTNAFEIVTNTGNVLSGKALRLYHGKNNHGTEGTSAIDNQWINFPINGDPLNVTGAFRRKFYVQACIWVDEFVDYYWRLDDGSLGGSKFFRLDDTRATNTGEFVLTNQYTRGFVTAYRRTSSGANQPWSKSLNTSAYTPNYAWQPAVVNATPATPTTEAQYRQKYGPMQYGMSGGTSQASPLHTQGVPDADAAIGGVAWNRGGITVVEVMVDLDSQSCAVWAAHHGRAPKKIIHDVGGANWGSRVMPDGVGWNCFEPTNLNYRANGTMNPGYPISWIDYAEVITSTNPINFPGGFPLP